uniref:EF-hand domain-containing protein n=1 Tax=Zooxanthella nutricula TaxID=1333877 RepID=A0A7S2K6X9_9DINO
MSLKVALQHEETPQSRYARLEVCAEIFVAVLIVLSTLVLTAQAEVLGNELGAKFGYAERGESNDDFGFALEVAEYACNAIFVLDLCIRIIRHGRSFFWDQRSGTWDAMNTFDLLVVSIDCFDLYVLQALAGISSGSVSSIRLVRLFRAARMLRVFRVSTAFAQLRVLIKTLTSSVMAFAWSMVILFLFLYAFALCINQFLCNELQNPKLSRDMHLWIYRHYGSASRAIWTMFEVTFSGGWPAKVRPLVEEVSGWYAVPFSAYISLVVFAVTRVITALFLKETMARAAEDVSMTIHEQAHKREQVIGQLKEFFALTDTSKDGFVTQEELENIMTVPEVRAYCSYLELPISEIGELFSILDDGDGFVSCDEFCSGVLKVKGAARSLDLLSVKHDCQIMMDVLRKGVFNRAPLASHIQCRPLRASEPGASGMESK